MPTATQGYAETFDLPQQAGLAATTQDKVINLEQKRQEKLEYLGANKQYANLDKSMTVMPGGNIESNKNKIWNDMSGANIQDMISDAANQSLTKDPNTGKLYFNTTGEEYTGATERAYMYGTKAGDGSVKFGLARGDLPSSDYRYQPGRAEQEGYKVGKDGYGWDAGPDGVDTSKNYMDMLLPYNVATALEGAVHGRKEALAGRKYPDYLSDEALQHASGVSEYYKSAEGMLGDTSGLTAQELAQGDTNKLVEYSKLPGAQNTYTQQGQLTQQQIHNIINKDSDSYLGNLVDSVQYGMGRTAASTADTLVDAVTRGAKEIAQIGGVKEEQANKIIQESAMKNLFNEKGNFTALDKYKQGKEYGYDDSRITEYGQRFKSTMADEKATLADKVGVVLEAVTHAPEVLASSSGDILLAMIPGGMGVFAANFANDVLEERQAIKNTSDLDPSDYGIATAAGIVAGTVNQLTGGMAGVSKGVAANVIKDGIKSMDMAAFKRLTEAVGLGTLEEATEESIQELAGIVGAKLDTSKQDEILSKQTALDVGLSAALGGGAGGFTSGVREVAGTVMSGPSGLSPEQMDVLEKEQAQNEPVAPKMSQEMKDPFWTKVAKMDGLDESGYRDRQDIKNLATDFVSGKDTSGILASDMDTKEKLEKVKALMAFVAEDSGLTDAHKATLAETLSKQLGMSPERVQDEIREAEQVGNAIKTLKTVNDVDREVTTGPRGFVTYYNQALNASRNGDTQTAEMYVDKLASFIGSQETKKARLAEAEKEVLREYNDAVQMAMEASDVDMKTAQKMVYKQWVDERNKDRGFVEVPYSDAKDAKPFKLFKSQVLENEVAKSKGEEYDRGGYAAISGIDKSIEAMKSLYGQLTGDMSVKDGLPEKTKQWLIKKLESASKEELVNLINKDTSMTRKQKEAVVGYLDETPTESDLPTVEEVAGDIMSSANLQDEIPDVPYEEPNNEIPDDVNMNFEEPDVGYVGMDEINQLFEEPNNETPVDVDTRNPGEPRSKKTALPLGNEARLVAKKGKILDEAKKELEKAKLDGNVQTVEDKLALVEKAKAWEDMKLTQTELKDLLEQRRATIGIGAKPLMDTFKVTKLTPLNVDKLELDEKIVEAIETAIPKAEITKGKKVVSENVSLDDPGRALLFNNDGSLNANVATALWKTMNDYIATSASGLAKPADLEKITEMFPNVSDEKAIDLLIELQAGGELLKFEAEGIGGDVMKLLGLGVADKAVSEVDIQAMKASLGMMVVHMAESKGLLEVKKIPFEGNVTTPVLTLGSKYKAGRDSVLDEMDRYENYDIPDLPKKSYSFNPINRRDVKVHNQPFTDVTPLQKEMKGELDQLEFKVNSGVDVLLEMYGNDPEGLKDALGRKKQSELDKMSYDGKKAAESVNREIETKVDGFFEMLKDAKLGDDYRPMFFEWFVTKGGRTNSYATVVDPQSDKQLARWLVTTAGSRVEMTKKDLDENTDKGVGFKYGLVQAFDGVLPEKVEVDKNSREKVIAMADKLLAMKDEDLARLIKEGKKVGDKVEHVEHIGHAMLGLANVRKAREGKFEADLVMEMDGLTNGLAFKFVQFPTSDVMELLPKVGVVLEGTKEYEAQTIAEVKDGDKKFGEFADLYETIGKKLKVPKLKDVNGKVQEVLKDVLPNLEDLKVARKLAKPMVMVTGYNAGEESTKLAQVNELVGQLVEDIVSGKVDNLKELEGLVKTKNLQGLLKENSILDKKLANFRKTMTNFYMEAYANPMYKALTDTIPELVKTGSAITSAYAYMYEVMLKEYDAEIAKMGRVPGQEEKIEIVRKLLTEVGPIVRNSETIGDLDMVLALSRKIVDMKDYAKEVGSTVTSINSKSTKEGSPVDSVQLVVRTFGEPRAAGGVLQTHTEDNHTMARTMVAAKKKFNQIFDAMVLGADQWAEVSGYNKSFYELNKEFSMLDAVIESVKKNLEKDDGSILVGIGKNSKSGKQLLADLEKAKVEIDANRAKIFGSKVKIGQMVGTNGTMYEVDPKEELARIEDMKAKMKEMIEGLGKGTGTVNEMLSKIAKKMECK